MDLSNENKNTLLCIAEWSIIDYLENGRRKFSAEKFKIDQFLESKQGAFVSVYINEDLHGCIGTFSESEALFENVHQMAVQAAFEDRRFKPVRESDLSAMRIEISVLSKRIRIKSAEEINIGKHGIYMIHGIRRATLLPQVAVKNNWTQIEFLECCAENKLGMDKNSWMEAELYIYEAIVFS